MQKGSEWARGAAAGTRAVVPLIAWTLFVWASRIRNIWTDEDLSTGGQALRTGFAVVFLLLALATGARLWIRRGSGLEQFDRWLIGAFITWTIGFWLVRGIGIIVDDHSAGFTVVHTVLMAISIGLAILARRALTRESISSSLAPAR